ncbi:MAG: response regulator [bacterium]|nr:response regulator [bacterium]
MIQVLIVEDDESRLQILRNLYKHQLITSCTKGEEAIRLLSEQTFNIVQLDYDLIDGPAGEEVAKFISTMTCKPIVVIHSENPTGANLMKNAHNESIVIPVSKIVTKSDITSRLKQYLSSPLTKESLPALRDLLAKF